jgi:ribosome-binding factor A
MSTQRIERVRELIKEEVSRIIQFDLRDPRIGMVTVTDATVSVDLRHARIYFTVLGDEVARGACLEALNHARKFIRCALAENVRLKYIPDITFEFDNTIERAMRIEQLLAEVLPPTLPAAEDESGAEDLADSEESAGE